MSSQLIQTAQTSRSQLRCNVTAASGRLHLVPVSLYMLLKARFLEELCSHSATYVNGLIVKITRGPLGTEPFGKCGDKLGPG